MAVVVVAAATAVVGISPAVAGIWAAAVTWEVVVTWAAATKWVVAMAIWEACTALGAASMTIFMAIVPRMGGSTTVTIVSTTSMAAMTAMYP
jgi:hypothetical protein